MDMTPEKFFFNVSQENNEQTFCPEAMLKERVGRLRMNENAP
jgi:hypothetical protein